MSTRLEWIEQEWRRFALTATGKRVLISPEMDLATVCKLFAAFCLNRLRMEPEVESQMIQFAEMRVQVANLLAIVKELPAEIRKLLAERTEKS